jgi:hypothetical protein
VFARERLIWLRHRLASMSAAEVGHRVREEVRRRTGRLRTPDFKAAARSGTKLPVIPGLVEGLDAVADVPELIDDWREVFERARRRHFHFLGRDWPQPPPVELWHADPVTGGTWPARTYCFAIPYRHHASLGDVKYVWELNRLQFLQPIAALARATGDRAAAMFCLDTLASWLEGNPRTGTG